MREAAAVSLLNNQPALLRLLRESYRTHHSTDPSLQVNPTNTPVTSEYVTAMVKGGENGFALKAGDATMGTLTTMFDGPRPNGYQPMKKQGSIILGIGGDNSDWTIGVFYEGVITSGYSTDAADAAVQANIVAAGYGK
jgi:hypothetical protein